MDIESEQNQDIIDGNNEEVNKGAARTSNQAARYRKKQRQKQKILDEKNLEDQQQTQNNKIQAEIDATVEELVAKKHQELLQETEKQKAIIQDLRDEILQREDKSDTKIWQTLEQFLHKFIGIPVHVYPMQEGRFADYVQRLKELEQARKSPVDSSDPDFPRSATTFIHEEGLHMGLDEEILDVLWQVKVTPWGSFSAEEKRRIETAIEIIMDYTKTTPAVTMNSSQKFKAKKQHQQLERAQYHEEDDEDRNAQHMKKQGKMYAAGWHGTRGERNVDIARYTVRRQGGASTRRRVLGEYTRTNEGFAYVAEQYAARLASMFPKEARMLSDFAIDNHIPSFADLEIWLNGEEAQTPFANSLTITNQDFANYVHRDRDAIDVAYGWWWTGFKEKARGHWELNEEYDHDAIKGGEFLLAEYAIAVDFSKTKGLVEIFWRGKKDYHVTMKSTSPRKVTRFGTSIQITQSGIRGMKSLERHGYDPHRIVGHEERVTGAESAIESIAN
ncbi:hypothetical protein FB446DRAFT_794519 [Lentinula raphanica]|nr:hypothetical protein FB446DRAFT_794519 [Lentinula raphanica]